MPRSIQDFHNIQWDREALGNKQLLFCASTPFKSSSCSEWLKRSRGSEWDLGGSDNPWATKQYSSFRVAPCGGVVRVRNKLMPFFRALSHLLGGKASCARCSPSPGDGLFKRKGRIWLASYAFLVRIQQPGWAGTGPTCTCLTLLFGFNRCMQKEHSKLVHSPSPPGTSMRPAWSRLPRNTSYFPGSRAKYMGPVPNINLGPNYSSII